MKVSKTFRLDKATLDAIEKLGEEENRTLNNMVETLLMRALKPTVEIKPFVNIDSITLTELDSGQRIVL